MRLLNMRAFVTGANGFLGSHLVDRLLERGDEVHVLVRKTSDLQWLLGKDVQFHYGDVSGDGKGLREGLEAAEVLFHVAGILRANRPQTYYEVNAQGTANLLQTCLEARPDIRRVVVVTSLAAHGPNPGDGMAREDDECHPIGDYGKSKRDEELIALKYGDRLPITIVRPPAIYGPRDDQILAFFRMVRRGLALLPGNGKGILNMTHVQDVVSGMLLAAEHPKAAGEIFFIGDDKNHTWEEAAEAIAGALERKALKLRVPGAFVYLVCGAAEALGRLARRTFALNLAYAKNFLQRNWAMDVSKAVRLLGYRPAFSLAAGAKDAAQWYVEEGWLK
ncbi:MAG TPA: NAD-dependent epimerase/dehydratase family protein [bacterium]|nr:NAD-dependent epimerase/dehydratase family protein [bacterium]